MTNLTPETLQGIVGSAREEITTDEEYQAAMAYISAISERLVALESSFQAKMEAHEEEVLAIKHRHHEITSRLKATLFSQRAICEQYLMDKGLEEPTLELKHTWAAEVFDLKDLVGAAAINPEYLEFLLPNQTKLNALARKNKSTMRVPGVIAVRKEKS